MAEPTVTVVVVNYRSGDHLGACLASLAGGGGPLARVLVIDNDSGDESWRAAEEMAARDPRFRLMHAGSNLGLAGAVDLVLDEIETPFLAILNPDVKVAAGWLEPLVEAMDDPGVGVACPLVLLAGTDEINSAGQHIHVTGLGFNRGLHRKAGWAGDRPQDVGGLHGAAFLIRTETLRDMGGWNDLGFLYHEDVALSWDVLLSGLRIVCVPASRVEHDYHITMYPEKLHLLERNRWALLLSHLESGRLLLISPAALLSELFVWGLCLIRGPAFIRAKWRSYRWVWRHRAEIADWREATMSRPVYRGDLLAAGTRWSYPVEQMGWLGGERGESQRVPPGGLPT